MAKGPFWLRGARGKLAGSVLFKGERGTIVRENVKPKNPKTNAQMRQRVVWATITQAAKKMLPIVGISFEGVNSEKLNRRRFVQLNASLFARHAQTPSMQDVCAWSGKGNNQLIPNPYIISRGTLLLPDEVLSPHFDDIYTPSSGSKTANIPFGNYTALQLIKILLGLEPGSQLTIPYITIRREEAGFAYTITEENEIKDLIRYAHFYAPRLVLKEASPTDSTLQITSTTTFDAITAFILNALDIEKSSQMLYDYILDRSIVTAGDSELTIQFSPNWVELFNDNLESAAAIGAIYSKQDANGFWRYSNCVLSPMRPYTLAPVEFIGAYYGLDIRNAIKTYKAEASRDPNYLQTGGQGGDID